jgi:hypothetical protein
MIRKILCFLGFHKWDQSRPLNIQDGMPFFGVPYDVPTRHCLCCPVTQRWLPGYGGSEWGCWMVVDTRQ